MTKFNWDRVSKENLDYRHRIKIIEDNGEYDHLYLVQKSSQIQGNHLADEFTSCNQCGAKIKSKNVKKHTRKIHRTKSKEIGEDSKSLQTNIAGKDTTINIPRSSFGKNAQQFRVNVKLSPGVTLYFGYERKLDTNNLNNAWCQEAIRDLRWLFLDNARLRESILDFMANKINERISVSQSLLMNCAVEIEFEELPEIEG